LLRLRAVLAMLRARLSELRVVPGILGPLRAGLGPFRLAHFIRIQWHQRSWLIRWEFLADLTRGF
jgi:hypothetical protein